MSDLTAELVLLHHNEPMTTSLAIAEGVQLQHKNVLELIRKHAESLLEFGSLAFETRVMRKDGRGGELGDVYFLNEPQATLLITFLRNSEIVIRFKVALVKAFYKLRDQVRAAQAAPGAFVTTNPAHAADQIVSADRIFRGLLRSGGRAGLRLPQALRRANAVARQRTGVDLLAELDVPEPEDTPESVEDALDTGSCGHFWQALIAGEIKPVVPGILARAEHLFELYRLWCARVGAYPAAQPRLLNTLAKKHGMSARRKRWVAGPNIHGPHSICWIPQYVEDVGDRYLVTPEPPAHLSETEWIGRNVLAFERALGAYRERREECEECVS